MPLSLIFDASLVITLVADGPAPPVQAKISGLKVLFSTLITLDSYFNFFCASWNLYASLISFGHDLARGLKILTSKNVRQNRESQSPLALMSSLASSSVVVVL